MSGELWSVGSGSVVRLFVARTQGLFKHPDRDGDLTPEDVVPKVEQVCDTTGFVIPVSWPAEWEMILDNFN